MYSSKVCATAHLSGRQRIVGRREGASGTLRERRDSRRAWRAPEALSLQGLCPRPLVRIEIESFAF